MANFLVLGDTHMPWMSKAAFTVVTNFLEENGHGFDYVVQIGDLYDLFSTGRWAGTRDLITPKEEFLQGRAMAEEFWKILQKRCPNAQCYQIMGNHDDRPMRQIIDKAPELASLLDIKHLWEFPGVKTQHDSRQELILDGICFMHGFRSQPGAHAKWNQMRTVVGHSHRGGVHFFPVRTLRDGKLVSHTAWELNAGYLGDPSQVPLQYSKQSLTNWTLGFAMIDGCGPRFCPIEVPE
jgi:predicted phosphodiesterase